MDQKCIIQECQYNIHAKGYCRRHYLQIWRCGRIISRIPPGRPRTKHIDREHLLESFQEEHKRLLDLYNAVVGLDGRLRYRKQIYQLIQTAKEYGFTLSEIIQENITAST